MFIVDAHDKCSARQVAHTRVLGRIIADVVESFRSLERDQHELHCAETAVDAVDGFLLAYGPYQ